MTDYSLSNKDISKFFGGKVNVLTYDQVSDCQTIEEVLGPDDRAVILYFWQTDPILGHWCAVFKTPRNTIEFFNSFGSVPDKTLNDIPIGFKKQHGEGFKTLTKLLYNSPNQIEYNNKCFQANDSSTCGRYCVLRLCCADIPIEQFQHLFTSNKKKNDSLVTALVQLH